MALDCSGTLVSNQIIEVAARGGFWIVKNGTSGDFTLTVRVTSQTGVTIDQGATRLVWSDGTDVALGNPETAATAEETVASATTTNILATTSEFVEISGTTTITSLGTGVNKKRFVRFTGALILTHHATTLILPGGANITTAAGDTMLVISDGSSNARIYGYQRASGAPLTLGDGTLAGDATLSGALTLSGIVGFTSTSHTAIAGGTTAQRPGSPAEGMLRKNTTLNSLEYHDGTTFINLATVLKPQGYLTLVTATPVMTSDQASKTTVYYTPDTGGYAPISDGSGWSARPFTELSLSLVSNHLASTIYDLFIWNDGGTPRFVTGPAWNTSTAGSGDRGTGAGTTELERLFGILTNKQSITVRYGASTDTMGVNEGLYVGSIFIDAVAGQVTCHRSYGQSRKWGLWNAYNRRDLYLKTGDSTASYNYTSATFREVNGNTANKATLLTGLAEETFDLSFYQRNDLSASQTNQNGIGWNSTSSPTGARGSIRAGGGGGNGALIMARLIQPPAIGVNDVTALESGSSGCTQFGGEEDCLLISRWMG